VSGATGGSNAVLTAGLAGAIASALSTLAGVIVGGATYLVGLGLPT
jgi:hypothetical protein